LKVWGQPRQAPKASNLRNDCRGAKVLMQFVDGKPVVV
jgi:hypothetical protein